MNIESIKHEEPITKSCFDSARKQIERQAQQRLAGTSEFENGYAEACNFALRALENESSNDKQTRSVDRVLNRISNMEVEIKTVCLMVDERLSGIFDKWLSTIDEAWEMINDQAR